MNRSLVRAPKRLVRWSTIAITLLLLFGADSASAIVVAKVVAGGAHSCELVPNGMVRCWGANDSGQLGTGDFTDHFLPTSVPGLTGVTALSAGEDHTCAVVGPTGSGVVMCWGGNYFGQLGVGDFSAHNSPQLVGGLTGVVNVVAGGAHTCALKSDATIRCWGANSLGQLGIGTTVDSSTPQLVGITGVTAIATGTHHTCAVKTSGLAACWGYNFFGQLGLGSSGDDAQETTPHEIFGLSGVTALAAGLRHTCARTSDAKVRCWGGNGNGQLGTGNNVNTTLPPAAPIALNSVTTISAGTAHSCAQTMAGSVWCWGLGEDGQLGAGSISDGLAPQPVSALNNATSVGAGSSHTCATKSDGRVACWGSNTGGQLGIGRATGADLTNPQAVTGIGPVTALSTGGKHTCARTTVGSVACWGDNEYGQLGTGNNVATNTPTIVSGLGSASSVDAGYLHSCAAMTNGTVRCWGLNGDGQLGTGNNNGSNVPALVAGGLTAVIATSASSGYHTCALTSTGMFRVQCWGANNAGQLGNAGAGMTSNVPVFVGGLQNGVSAIASGYRHTCALTSTGKVRCWGLNGSGQLGTGDNFDTDSPAAEIAALTGVTAIAAGDNHTCALTSNGLMRCWGRNGAGQLGTGNTQVANTPQPVVESAGGIELSGVTAIAAGRDHTCAVGLGGTVRCWGANDNGQLGIGSHSSSTTPKPVPALTGVIAIAAGDAHTCALLANQTAVCWGQAYSGQLGNGEFGYNSLPLITEGLLGDGFE